MSLFELSALLAALCWAMASLVSAGPAAHLGAIRFNQMRMLLVFLMLVAWVSLVGGWETLELSQVGTILLSGFIGIFLGDTALFLTLNRMGPRRTSILFAMNAPLAVLLGWLFLDEQLTTRELTGVIVILAGVVLAIAFGKRRDQLHQWERVKGPLWAGLLVGFAAALAQASGAIIIRPVMAAGADPVAASAIRVGISALGLSILVQLPFTLFKPVHPIDFSLINRIALSGFLGMGLGMTLLLYALSGGEVGIISTLAATSPALLLPLLWVKTGERPAMGAWVGAGLAIFGSWMIFSS